MDTIVKTKAQPVFSTSNHQEGRLTSLHELFVHELSELLDAEKQMMDKLNEYQQVVTSSYLTELIEDHTDITEIQVKRLEEIFNQFQLKSIRSYNNAIRGLIKEGDDLNKTVIDPLVKDSAIIASIQKIKHYEIACYGCLRTFAMVLGYDEASDLLQATLDEETMMDKKLTEIAEAFVNEDANHL